MSVTRLTNRLQNKWLFLVFITFKDHYDVSFSETKVVVYSIFYTHSRKRSNKIFTISNKIISFVKTLKPTSSYVSPYKLEYLIQESRGMINTHLQESLSLQLITHTYSILLDMNVSILHNWWDPFIECKYNFIHEYKIVNINCLTYPRVFVQSILHNLYMTFLRVKHWNPLT